MTQSPRHGEIRQNLLIALGGNVTSKAGRPENVLAKAIEHVAVEVGEILGESRLYRTPCFPKGAGPDYVNAAISVSTNLTAQEVLAALHRIEAHFGRERVQRWGQRTLDLDLLAYGDVIAPDRDSYDHWHDLPIEEQKIRAPDQLILPHPRLHERAFVLVPLMDVAPQWSHPVLGKTVKEMVDALDPHLRAEVVAI